MAFVSDAKAIERLQHEIQHCPGVFGQNKNGRQNHNFSAERDSHGGSEDDEVNHMKLMIDDSGEEPGQLDPAFQFIDDVLTSLVQDT